LGEIHNIEKVMEALFEADSGIEIYAGLKVMIMV